jgi:chitodextrinase
MPLNSRTTLAERTERSSFARIFRTAGNHRSVTALLLILICTGSLVAGAASGNSGHSSNDHKSPSTPTGLAVTATSSTTISVAWAASTDAVGVTGYDVLVNGNKVGSTALTSYTATGLSCNTRYTLAVDAYDAAGNKSRTASVNAKANACSDTQAPSAPANLSEPARTSSSATLSWSAAKDDVGVAGYDLSLAGIKVGHTAQTSYTFSGLSCASSYAVQVDAYDAAGNRSAPTGFTLATSQCTDTTAPSQPATLAVTIGAQASLSLAWSVSTDNVGVAGYDVYQNGSRVTRTSQTSYLLSSLACGTTYQIGVDAYDAAGNTSAQKTMSATTSACSSSSSGGSSSSSSDTQAPTVPSDLQVTASTQASVNLSWTASTDNVGVAGYDLYRDGTKVGTSTQTSYAFGSLTCGTSYTLAIDAYDAAGNVSSGAQVVATTGACPDTQSPSQPTNLTELMATGTSVVVTWGTSTDNFGVVGYSVYQGATLAGTTAQNSYTVTGLSCGTSYNVYVDAYDAAGNHSTKATAFVTTSACPDTQAPSTPTVLATTSIAQTSIGLSWSASTDNVLVSGYDLFLNGTKVGTSLGTSYTFSGLACGTTYTLGVDAYDNSGNRSAASRTSATTAACQATSTGATGYRTLVQPAFTPTRVLTATTPAQFSADLANLQSGDELDVQPMTISGEVKISNSLSSYAEIHFAPGVYFTGSATDTDLPAVWIVQAKNIRIYGGDLTNYGGGCILAEADTNILWWGWKAHDCGGGGLSVFNAYGAGSSGLDFDGEISNSGLDLSDDPHTEVGTGQHAAYIGGGDTAYTVDSSKFSLYVHDQPYGAAVQAGSNISNSEFWVKATNVTFDAQSQVAGNAIQFWGGALKNITVHEVTGANLAGRVVETNGMYSCCNSNIVVQYGRGTNTMENPLLSGSTFAPNAAVTYQDVQPLP